MPLEGVISARVSASGSSGYAYGLGPFSDLAVEHGSPPKVKTLRFPGESSAKEVVDAIERSRSRARPISPAEPELAELGFPPNYGLPARPEKMMAIAGTGLRSPSRIGRSRRASSTWQSKNVTQLIDDERLVRDLDHRLVLAAAYYVRGWAFEKKGDLGLALIDYRQAVEIEPGTISRRARWDG